MRGRLSRCLPRMDLTRRTDTMQWSGWIYFGFTIALFIAFIVVVIYYYNPKKKEKIEKPKYKMFDDEEKDS